MKLRIKEISLIAACWLFLFTCCNAQVISLDSVVQRIGENNHMLLEYDINIIDPLSVSCSNVRLE